MSNKIEIRTIRPSDNPFLAKIIRGTLEEYNCALPGTAYYDVATDALYEAYQTPKTNYFVGIIDGAVAGGSGIGELEGETHVCELQKMYIGKAFRGNGLANLLMDACLDFAKQAGYSKIYLETKKELSLAVPWYKKRGFEEFNGVLGNTGHHSCEIKMIRSL